MLKYSFYNDYSEGAHPKILEMLMNTNLQQQYGYGLDEYSLDSERLIQNMIGRNVDVHFISGGTHANLTVLASMMKPYEAVISANTGHINVHEAGAIEATGHKIIDIESKDGKLSPELIQLVLDQHDDEHAVMPKVVFISNSTELGTIYNEAELKSISEYCRKKGLYLYLDGARLGSGLMSKDSDLDLTKIADYVDAFYIGGTKNGALLGEAIVLINNEIKQNFRYHLKQRGALLAKGRILGIQFKALFENNLYFDLAKHANNMAEKLSLEIKNLGYNFLTESTTNQIFPIFPNSLIEKLSEMYGFYTWSKIDDVSSSIRLVTSWATQESAVEEFINDLKVIQ
ncbi:MAG: low specificity L-threonine aldolase [bacterium]